MQSPCHILRESRPPAREVCSGRIASPPDPSSTTTLPPQARQSPYRRQTARIRAADPRSVAHQELPSSPLRPLSSTCYHRGASPSDRYAIANLTESVKFLHIGVEWALDDADVSWVDGRRAWSNTRRSGANNDTQNEVKGLIARRINASLSNLISQIAASLNARQTNNRGSSSNTDRGCSYKTFIASKPKEFYGTEGVVGLLGWFEDINSKLNITKCADGRKVESPTQALAVPPPDVPLPHRRSSLPPLDTTTKDIISEFIIPEATTTIAPVRRVGTFQTLRARAMWAEAQIAILWGLLGIYIVRIADLEFRAEDRLEQCERGWIHDMARIRRLEEYLGIGQ
ncbi:hypothetical protein Tco_0413839 [Tanacetum coccineum]